MFSKFLNVEHNSFGEQVFRYVVRTDVVQIVNQECDWQDITPQTIESNRLTAVKVYQAVLNNNAEADRRLKERVK